MKHRPKPVRVTGAEARRRRVAIGDEIYLNDPDAVRELDEFVEPFAAGATVIPDSWTPRRKWFAGAAGLVVVNGAAALGLDIGAVGAEVAEAINLPVEEADVEGVTRSGIGMLAGAYLWPEWRSLPDAVRGALRKLTKPLR